MKNCSSMFFFCISYYSQEAREGQCGGNSYAQFLLAKCWKSLTPIATTIYRSNDTCNNESTHEKLHFRLIADSCDLVVFSETGLFLYQSSTSSFHSSASHYHEFAHLFLLTDFLDRFTKSRIWKWKANRNMRRLRIVIINSTRMEGDRREWALFFLFE